MAREREGFTPGSGVGTGPGQEDQGIREAARRAGDQAKEKAHDVKERLQERSRELGSEAERRADRWTDQAGEQIERVARALRKAGDALEGEGEGRMSAVSMSVAEQIERMGEYLRDENPRGMMSDFEDMARRNPGAFLGTTFVAGLLVGRFLRSSEPEESSGAEARQRAGSWTGGRESYEGRGDIGGARVGSDLDGGGALRGGSTRGWEGER